MEGLGVLFLAFFVLILVFLFFSFIPVGLWISAWAAGVRVPLITLVAMRLRRVPPAKIIYPLIPATKAGLDVRLGRLEAHYAPRLPLRLDVRSAEPDEVLLAFGDDDQKQCSPLQRSPCGCHRESSVDRTISHGRAPARVAEQSTTASRPPPFRSR